MLCFVFDLLADYFYCYFIFFLIYQGPISLVGMVLGFLGSGFFISKVKPRPSRLLSWNVFGGFVAFIIQISYIFIGCDQVPIEGVNAITME